MDGLLDTTSRSIILYLVIIIAMRLRGKKGLAQLTLNDFILVLLITKSVYNDQGLIPGIGMVIGLAVINYLLDLLIYKSKGARNLLEGKSKILIDDGKLLPNILRSEKMTEDELLGCLRQQGVTKVNEVKWAILEVDGSVSVIPKK